MYTYIVVDDEHLIRKGIISIINQIQDEEYTCVGEAADGDKALEIIRAKRPDIVITDMRMKGMSGRQLLDAMQDLVNETAVIVISGFSDWEYTSKAIEKKVVGYILKPFSKEELQDVMKKAVGHIEQRKKIKNLEEQSKGREINRGSIYQLLTGKWNDIPIERKESIKSEENFILLTMLTTDVTVKSEIIIRLKAKFGEQAFLCDENPMFINEYSVLFHGSMLDGGFIDNIIGAIKSPENIRSGCKTIICISGPVDSGDKLSEIYNKNIDMLGDVKLGWKFAVLDSRKPRREAEELIEPEELERMIMEMKHHPDRCERIMDEIFARVQTKRDLLGSIYVLIKGVVDSLNIYASGLGVKTEDIMAFFLRRYAVCFNIDKMRDEVKGYIRLLFESVEEKHGRSKTFALSIIQYIDDNFGGKITEQSVADEFFLSYTSCSALIKKHTGMTFSEYLTETRINHAKTLLMKTDMTVNQISYEVGYANPKYFFRVFKKSTGMTPETYRKTETGN